MKRSEAIFHGEEWKEQFKLKIKHKLVTPGVGIDRINILEALISTAKQVEEVVGKLKQRFKETDNLEMKAEIELILEMLIEEE